MRFFFSVIFIGPFIKATAQDPSVPIGMWKEYLPYNSAADVAAGDNKIYCATPCSLFTVDLSDNSGERSSRIIGLSETVASAIHYDENNYKLLIAYANSNIDIIYRTDIFNISDRGRKRLGKKNFNGDSSCTYRRWR